MVTPDAPLLPHQDHPVSRHEVAPSPATFLRVVRSELSELRRRKRSAVLLGVAIAGMTAVSMLGAAALMAGYDGPSELVNRNSVQGLPTVGLYFGHLLVATLGVLVVTSERRTATAGSTVAAASTRTRTLLARAVVVGLAGAVVGVVGRLAGYILIQPILAQHGLDFALGSAEFWTSLAGSGIYFALIAIMAAGIGSLLRNSAAGIVTVIGLLFLAPMVLWLTPGEVAAAVVNFLPSEAGAQLMLLESAPGDLTPLQGGLLLAAWAALPLVAGIRASRNGRDE